MSDKDIERAVAPFWRDPPITTIDGVIAKKDAELDALRARVAELEAEERLASELIEKQGKLLTAAVNALRGPPPPLTLHSHHDVGTLAATVVAENARLREDAKRHRDAAHGWERVARRRGAALERISGWGDGSHCGKCITLGEIAQEALGG